MSIEEVENTFRWLVVIMIAVIGIGYVLSSCAETVNHKVSGDTHSELTVSQDVCTEKNGFITPDQRRDCILCLRNVNNCPPCGK